jgi:hypothetical protein
MKVIIYVYPTMHIADAWSGYKMIHLGLSGMHLGAKSTLSGFNVIHVTIWYGHGTHIDTPEAGYKMIHLDYLVCMFPSARLKQILFTISRYVHGTHIHA